MRVAAQAKPQSPTTFPAHQVAAAHIPDYNRSGVDTYVEQLRRFFLEHPVWVEAARTVRDGAQSRVFFSHLPGEWHLSREGGRSLLLEGPAQDPDLAFRFTPASVGRLTAVDGDIGDFAVALFACATDPDPEARVEFRVLAPFTRLLSRGYVQVLLRGGPKVLAFGASRGVRTLADLRRLLKHLQDRDLGSSLTEGKARG